MARVNITVPDELLERARDTGLTISAVTAAALREELSRRERIVALDRYLEELEAELGPIPDEERAEATEWADRELARGEPNGFDGRPE